MNRVVQQKAVRRIAFLRFGFFAAALLLLGLPGTGSAVVLCPNQATPGGFGSYTFAPFVGSQDSICGANSGVTLAISPDTDYAKLMWNAPSPLPAGLTLGNLGGVSALVTSYAQQAVDPYFILAFTDASKSFGQASATDQMLLIEFQPLGISGVGQTTMTINPNTTLFNVYDNATGTYLLGGQSHTNTLHGYLTTYPALATESLSGVWLAIGLAGGCGTPGGCLESLAVDSVNLTTISPIGGALDGPYQVSFAANLNVGETYIDITNDGALGAAAQGTGIGTQSGNMCVNVYAFDQNEEMISCCSCFITPDQTFQLGANADLTSNTVTGAPVNSITIKLLASVPATTGSTACANSAALVGNSGIAGLTAVTLATGGMLAWRTTLHPTPTSGQYATTESAFLPASLSAGEEQALVQGCAAIIGHDSGKGICLSCHLGALGATKM